jgi:dienelactone hydrolase
MEKVMGPLPDIGTPALDVESGPAEDFPEFRRQLITFVSEVPASGGKPDRVPAFLLVPKEIKRGSRAPAVLCLHQTTRIGKGEPAGVGGKPDLQYGAELARRGFVTLVPDYPNFGDYTFDPYAQGYVSATMKAILNHKRAIDLLQSLPEVDPDRIGVIGHSLGGHNSLFLAAFEPRVKAVVTSCGFNSFSKYKGGDLTGWSHKGYMPRIAEVYSKDPARMPFDFTEVLAALAPRPVFINAPLGDSNFEVSGVKDCVTAAHQVYDQVFHARDRLEAVYPQAGHEFPLPIRLQAYTFLERWLS